MRSKLVSVVMVLALVGTAFGALYVGVSYVASAYMCIPPNEGITTMVDTGEGYATEHSFGAVSGGDTLNIWFAHVNHGDVARDGMLRYEIECVDGLNEGTGNLSGMMLEFVAPNSSADMVEQYKNGVLFWQPTSVTPINNASVVTWVSGNKTCLVPLDTMITFDPSIQYLSALFVTFADNACGDYTVRGYVDEADDVSAGAIIVNHTCVDIGAVPMYWVMEAKQMFNVSYGHTSHGSQIVTGMDLLEDENSVYRFDSTGSNGGLLFRDGYPAGDLGNPNRYAWADRTRVMLDDPSNDKNVVMWSWCGQVDGTEAEIDMYLSLMDGLETDYPDVMFIYMTGHLEGTGETGLVNIRNEQIRDYCVANDKILFDFADIESYDPDGITNYMLLDANDNCDYDGGNWADEWCTANPGECVSCSCAHSKCLNCQMKGEAFWWMMAKMAGW